MVKKSKVKVTMVRISYIRYSDQRVAVLTSNCNETHNVSVIAATAFLF